MKMAQVMISLPCWSADGTPRRMRSRMAAMSRRQRPRTPNSRSMRAPRNTTSGIDASTAVPATVPSADPTTPIGARPGMPGNPSFGTPRRPNTSA